MHHIDGYPQARTISGLPVYRYDSPLFFANAEDFRRRALAAVGRQTVPVRWFVLSTEANVEVDITALDAVDELRRELVHRGAVFALARVKQVLLGDLNAYGLADSVGTNLTFPTLPIAVAAYRPVLDVTRSGTGHPLCHPTVRSGRISVPDLAWTISYPARTVSGHMARARPRWSRCRVGEARSSRRGRHPRRQGAAAVFTATCSGADGPAPEPRTPPPTGVGATRWRYQFVHRDREAGHENPEHAARAAHRTPATAHASCPGGDLPAGDAHNELVGMSWLFAPHVWHLNATASTPVRAYEFDATAVRSLCQDDDTRHSARPSPSGPAPYWPTASVPTGRSARPARPGGRGARGRRRLRGRPAAQGRVPRQRPRPGHSVRRLDDLAKAGGLTAGDLMTSPALTVRADATLAQAPRTMAHAKVKRLPVVGAVGMPQGISAAPTC